MDRRRCVSVLVKNVVFNSRIHTCGAPYDKTRLIFLVCESVVGDDPIMRNRILRSRMLSRVIPNRTIHLNAVGQVVINEIVRDRERGAIPVNAVILGTSTSGTRKASVVVDLIAVDQDPGAIPEYTLAGGIMVNPIAPNREIMGIVELNPIVAIAYLKSLNCDPTHRIPNTGVVLNKNHLSFRLVDTVNDRERARSV